MRAIPVSPQNLTITIVNSTDVHLSWQAVTQDTDGLPFTPDGYIVFCTTDVAQNSASVFLSATANTLYDHPGVVAAFEYILYFVVAYQGSMQGSMVYVQGGTFNNGTSDVTISSFYLDRFELTQAGYQVVMGANPAVGNRVGATYPIYSPSWFNAIEYCNRRSLQEGLTPCYSYSTYSTNPENWPAGWNTSDTNHINVSCNWSSEGYRLPTEMEWMFAAKGGALTPASGYPTYSGSNDLNAVGWYYSNSSSTIHTVGGLAPNQLGLYDMSGNLWEWTWDIIGSYPGGAQTDPHGATSGSYRMVRGGAFDDIAFYCTVSSQFNVVATYSNIYIGFRVARIIP